VPLRSAVAATRAALSFSMALPVLVALLGNADGAQCGYGTPCRCGDRVTGDAQLAADLGPCDGNGLVLKDGVTLDCQGHTVRGRTGRPDLRRRTRLSVGITLDRTLGASVRRCRVTGFDYGIRLSGAWKSQVIGSEAFRNGNFVTHVGYGIHLSRAQRNTVQGCVVHENADEGIHIGNGSDGNTLIGNQAYDNTRENYYILSARENRLLRNRARGKVSADLYMKHALDNRIEGNQFDDRPVVVRGRSSGNIFADNDFGAGLRFEAYGEGPDEAPTENVVRGGHLRGRQVCLEFLGAHDNRIEAVLLQGCPSVVSRATAPAVNDLIGIDLAGVRLDLADSASLRLLTRVQISVRTAAARPVPEARISLRDGLGDAHQGPTTDRSGVAVCEVPLSRVTASGRTTLTPVAVTVGAKGYTSNRAAIAGPAMKVLTVTLTSSERRNPPGSEAPGVARPRRGATASTPGQERQ
jgi:parallel beta-helix repeat protein